MVSIAAALLGLLAFITPVQVFIQSIPSCVFGGCAMILYGYIACSGLKTIINNKTDLEDNKNLIIVSVILTVGVSGIFLFTQSFAGTSLAMVLGVILNLILRNRKVKTETKN
jgi:uracil permease